ncbi:hypothetical protein BCR39DRAFT_512942 [Naematelia encephala]|uniref:Uncharacterized protein n=1 Tax=Naematelia encephala TaxID=71784 RepID=A0A1Y2BMD9_9TREE|nr:hypothetical protein BCR39DRAFT_512942 [Naematelia encephala]
MIQLRRTRATLSLALFLFIGLLVFVPSSYRPSAVNHFFTRDTPETERIQEYVGNKLEPYFPKHDWSIHGREDYKHHTEGKLRELAVCIATDTCRENQTTVVIYGFIHSHFHLYNGYMGGEGIWVSSLTKYLEEYGYTILHARDDWHYMWYVYNQIPDMVKAVLAYPGGQYGTFKDYVKTDRKPDGIPAWKVFLYNYFPYHYDSPVGDAWNVHSELGYGKLKPNFTFLPYELDLPQPPAYVPTEERPYRVYILAKFLRYFYHTEKPWYIPAWENTTFFSAAKADLEVEFPGFEFVVGCYDDRKPDAQQAQPMELPDGIRNLGRMGKEEFEEQLKNSRALLGIGWPTLSPSPHQALNLGIPFISPFSLWRHSKIADKTTWAQTQHETLKALDPPFVYHAERGNYTSFIDAIRGAMSTPIPQFRFTYATPQNVKWAIGEWMATDWRSRAEEILERRKAGQEETENGKNLEKFVM